MCISNGAKRIFKLRYLAGLPTNSLQIPYCLKCSLPTDKAYQLSHLLYMTFFWVVLIMCNVSFIVCVALCVVLSERGVLFYVLCVLMPPGKNAFHFN
jgi:hypothetical protein